MSYLINNQQKINDVIFTDRNKSYGAYSIRSDYGNTVAKSLLIMLTGMALLSSVAYYLTNRKIEKIHETVKPEHLKVIDVIFEEKKELPKKNCTIIEPKNTGGKPATSLSTNIIDSTMIATNNSVTIENMATSTGSSTGTETSSLSGTGTGSVVNTATTSSITETTHFFVDSEPEFEGGIKALYKFLADNLRYPEDAKEAAVEGTLHLKFVVDKNGKVCDIEPQNKLGFGLDKEALRVAALIPNFKKPGMVKGQAVKVYYQLPIKFKLR